MAGSAELLLLLTARDHASGEFDKVGDKFKALGQKMQLTGAAMSAAITAPFVLFAKHAIEGASDTEESMNKVRVVFGETAKDIESFAKSGAQSLGISNQAALEAAGTFGNLFKGMGLSSKATTSMSKDVLKLAADLGSFNNVPIEEVLENIRSGLVGEAEPMRKFGVLINEASVKAEAMALGLGNVKGELTEQEKVQARFSLIMKQTTSAQGDFANTADGLANSQKIAGAQMADLTAEMGKAMLPIMIEGTKIVKGLMEKFMSLSPEVKNVILIVVGLVAVIGPLLIVFGTLLTVLPAIGAAFLLLTGPIGLVILAITLVALVWATNVGDIQGKTKAMVEFVQDAFDGFKLFVLQLWRGIVTGIANAVNGIIGILNGFIDAYNALADALGLPMIGKIELLTPNLDAVDAAIAQVAKDREARLTVRIGYIDPGPPALGRTYAKGTDHITTGPELFLAGEAGPERVVVTPLANGTAAMSGSVAGAGGGGLTINIGTVYGMPDFEQKVGDAVRRLRSSGGLRGV